MQLIEIIKQIFHKLVKLKNAFKLLWKSCYGNYLKIPNIIVQIIELNIQQFNKSSLKIYGYIRAFVR